MLNFKKKIHPDLFNIFKKNILKEYRVIIKFKSNTNNLIKKLKRLKSFTLIHEISEINIVCSIISHKNMYDLIESPEVCYISPDNELFLCGNKNIVLEETKETTSSTHKTFEKITGKNICVGIIDSGVYPIDNFLKPKNRILLFKDLLNDYEFPYDDNGHGSAMCNIIGNTFIHKNKILKNAHNCNFAVIKAFDKFNKSYSSTILKGLSILYENISNLNIQILCLPFELKDFNEFILNIFNEFFDKFSKNKIIVILPSGNNYNTYSSIKGLALLENCLTVSGNLCPYSSKGVLKPILKPDVSSICENIYVENINVKYIPQRNNQYIYPPKMKKTLVEYFGTSCSCAYVCSLITLLKEKNPTIELKDLLSLLKITCIKRDYENKSLEGLGEIDLNLLLE